MCPGLYLSANEGKNVLKRSIKFSAGSEKTNYQKYTSIGVLKALVKSQLSKCKARLFAYATIYDMYAPSKMIEVDLNIVDALILLTVIPFVGFLPPPPYLY